MSLISLSDVCLRYGVRVLLNNANMSVSEGDMLALIGRNGCGKTTLLKVMAGLTEVDSGLVERARGASAAYLPQDVPVDLSGTAYSCAAQGLGEIGKTLSRYRELLPSVDGSDAALHAEYDKIIAVLDETDSWSLDSKIMEILDRLEIPATLDIASASAGLKRRALLGRELAKSPDILLLDEPTNHLDIDSVVWLEKFIKTCGKTVVFVSHDREFLRRLATRVVEVDRGRLISFACGFDEFVGRRDDLIESMERNEAVFDKKLAQEEAWLRRGIKARRTRNEGRVRELVKMRQTRAARIGRKGEVNLLVREAENGGQKVMDVKNITVSYGGAPVIKNFSTTIYRGDKIGIVGRNGIGKTTLLNALLGNIKPNSGEISYGTSLKIGYFDQLRSKLDPDMTLFDFIGGGSDNVGTASGTQNVMGYLKNFLFEPQQVLSEIGMLSGGERNRLMLAKLFATPANMLVLDEPTNDLDIQTIDILESNLVSFGGTVLLVSHDRAFLNNVVSGIFGFEDGGNVVEMVGGYDEWKSHCQKLEIDAERVKSKSEVAKQKSEFTQPKRAGKLTNKERADLESIPVRIEELEAEMAELEAKIQDNVFINAHFAELGEINERISAIQTESDKLFERWAELDEKRQGGA